MANEFGARGRQGSVRRWGRLLGLGRWPLGFARGKRVASGEWRAGRKSRFLAALGMTIHGGFGGLRRWRGGSGLWGGGRVRASRSSRRGRFGLLGGGREEVVVIVDRKST